MKINKIIILDDESGNVYMFDFDNNIYEDFSDFVVDINKKYDLNLSESNCQWMIRETINIIVN